MDRIEKIILKNIINNESYVRKILPFIKDEYFSERAEKIIFQLTSNFVNKYKNLPTNEALIINLKESNCSENDFNSVVEILTEIKNSNDTITNTDEKWLIEHTEKFCQDKAIYNAVMNSVNILTNKDERKGRGEIPKLLSDALGVSFDNRVGHDYIEEYTNRYDFYHKKEKRILFDIDFLNKITKGGLPSKTLNICLAGTGVGKSLFMCHHAAAALSQGHNVLYITLEMAEERIAERIDANLLNVPLDTLEKMTKSDYEKRFSALKSKTHGRLIIKEYPTASASTLHFRNLLNELVLKKNFRPQILFVDYLNICSSARLKPGSNVNSYMYIKAIAEELRGLAVEFDIPIFSATQTTRSGFASSDPDLTDTSESFGLPATADMMFAMISTEELEELNQIMIKQLKNRYSDPTNNKRFVLGIDRAKMRLYDVDLSAQKGLDDSGQKDDKPINTFGNRENKFSKNFKGLKV